MVNNPLTYFLTMAKLDATGQYWVASSAKYSFHLHYKSGKQNMEADALSCILWDHNENLYRCHCKAIMDAGIGGNSALVEAYAGSVVLDYQEEVKCISTGKEPLVICKKAGIKLPEEMTIDQWKKEQNIVCILRYYLTTLTLCCRWF